MEPEDDTTIIEGIHPAPPFFISGALLPFVERKAKPILTIAIPPYVPTTL